MSVAAATSEAHPHGAGFAIEEPVTDEDTRRGCGANSQRARP